MNSLELFVFLQKNMTSMKKVELKSVILECQMEELSAEDRAMLARAMLAAPRFLAAHLYALAAIVFGWICGVVLNKARGREMVTSYILGFFMNGVYQLVVLYMMGSIIPIIHNSIKLPRGYGIRSSGA